MFGWRGRFRFSSRQVYGRLMWDSITFVGAAALLPTAILLAPVGAALLLAASVAVYLVLATWTTGMRSSGWEDVLWGAPTMLTLIATLVFLFYGFITGSWTVQLTLAAIMGLPAISALAAAGKRLIIKERVTPRAPQG